MNNKIEIRSFRDEDFSRIMEIENSSFSDPWSESLMESSLGGKLYTMLVAEYDGRLSGYINVCAIPGESGLFNGDAEIMNLAVADEYRRRNIADELINSAVTVAKEKLCNKIFLEVRESNIPAIALYKKHGFENYGIRKNYYENPRENAILMKLSLCGQNQ